MKFKDILDQINRFYKNSPVQTAGLKEIQELLNDPRLNLTQAKDVHWFSHDKAVSHLRKCFHQLSLFRKEIVLKLQGLLLSSRSISL